MKLLMFNTKNFLYKTFKKTVDTVENIEKEENIGDTIAVFFLNSEKEDEERLTKVPPHIY